MVLYIILWDEIHISLYTVSVVYAFCLVWSHYKCIILSLWFKPEWYIGLILYHSDWNQSDIRGHKTSITLVKTFNKQSADNSISYLVSSTSIGKFSWRDVQGVVFPCKLVIAPIGWFKYWYHAALLRIFRAHLVV